MNLVSKYNIGEAAYLAKCRVTTKKIGCPDCKGTQRWKVITPTGSEFETYCGRCVAGNLYEDDLTYRVHEPVVEMVNIAKVYYENPPGKFKYLLGPMGATSGSVVEEDALFDTYEEAMAKARYVAHEANSTQSMMNTHRTKVFGSKYISMRILDWNLTKARDEAQKYLSVLHEIEYLLEDREPRDDNAEEELSVIKEIQEIFTKFNSE